MHCAGCHAAQEQPEFAKPADHGYQAIGDFRAGLHMIPGHDILAGIEARRLDRAEHKVELSDDAGVVAGYNKVAVYAQDQFDIVKNLLRAVGRRPLRRQDEAVRRRRPRRVSRSSTRRTIGSSFAAATRRRFAFRRSASCIKSSWFLTVSTEIGIPPFPLSVFQPNPNLKPEEISTWDLGGEYQISPTVSMKADLYRSRVHDFIVIVQHFNPLPNPSTLGWENQPADARITGGEVELRSNFAQRVTGFVNWSHQSESQMGSGVDSSGTPFEFVYSPKDKINLGAYGGPVNGVRGAIEVAWRGTLRRAARLVRHPLRLHRLHDASAAVVRAGERARQLRHPEHAACAPRSSATTC